MLAQSNCNFIHSNGNGVEPTDSIQWDRIVSILPTLLAKLIYARHIGWFAFFCVFCFLGWLLGWLVCVYYFLFFLWVGFFSGWAKRSFLQFDTLWALSASSAHTLRRRVCVANATNWLHFAWQRCLLVAAGYWWMGGSGSGIRGIASQPPDRAKFQIPLFGQLTCDWQRRRWLISGGCRRRPQTNVRQPLVLAMALALTTNLPLPPPLEHAPGPLFLNVFRGRPPLFGYMYVRSYPGLKSNECVYRFHQI